MSFKLEGSDGLIDDLKREARDYKAKLESTLIPGEDLLTDSFISNHTKFSSFEELLSSGGFSTDFEEIDDDNLDEYIKSNTPFESLDDMIFDAAEENGTI